MNVWLFDPSLMHAKVKTFVQLGQPSYQAQLVDSPRL